MIHTVFPIELLRPFWLPEIQNVKRLYPGGFKAWLNRAAYTFNSAPTGNLFRLDPIDISLLAVAFATDISRMSVACFESIHALHKSPTVPKSTAWTLIRLYYSAFFAAHAILRIFGICCSYFGNGQIAELKKNALLQGYSWAGNVCQGIFACHYDPHSRELKCTRNPDTHADTWKVFNRHLQNLSTRVLEGSGLNTQKETLSSFLIELSDSLQCRGRYQGGHWLSILRNQLNYQHEHGAWFPYNGAQLSHEDILRKINKWNCDLSSITMRGMRSNETAQFTETCVTVVALCKALIDDMHLVSKVNQSFTVRDTLTFLKQAQMLKRMA